MSDACWELGLRGVAQPCSFSLQRLRRSGPAGGAQGAGDGHHMRPSSCTEDVRMLGMLLLGRHVVFHAGDWSVVCPVMAYRHCTALPEREGMRAS